MRFMDIQRQKGTWMKQCQYTVLDVGEPCETKYGLCQVITLRDAVGQEEPVNYFYDDEMGEIKGDEIGEQWYDIRWKDEGYYQGKPAEARKEPELEPNNVWERKDLRIARMSCIKSAVEWLRGDTEAETDDVIDAAGTFLDWIYKEEKP